MFAAQLRHMHGLEGETGEGPLTLGVELLGDLRIGLCLQQLVDRAERLGRGQA